jgi:hypothetical protein
MAETHSPSSSPFIHRVLIKTLLLLLAANLVFTLFNPMPLLGRVSLYNVLFPGRPRLPFGEVPDKAYNFSLLSMDAMLASHEISRPKAADEYRVVVVGDSSVWGTLLRPEETLSGVLNARGLRAPDGRHIRVYNLGYPTISLAKDDMILVWARQYQPDAVIWLTTLEAFPEDKQDSLLLQQNEDEMTALLRSGSISIIDRLPEPSGRAPCSGRGAPWQTCSGCNFMVFPGPQPASTSITPKPTSVGPTTCPPTRLSTACRRRTCRYLTWINIFSKMGWGRF